MHKLLLTLIVSIVLSACASTIPLNKNYWNDKHKKVAIKVNFQQKPMIFSDNPNNIVESKILSKLHSGLINELNSENQQWLNKLALNLQAQFKKKGIQATVLHQNNLNEYDELLTLTVTHFGAQKENILSKPSPYIAINGKLVNIQSQKTLWSARFIEHDCVLNNIMRIDQFILRLHCTEKFIASEIEQQLFGSMTPFEINET